VTIEIELLPSHRDLEIEVRSSSMIIFQRDDFLRKTALVSKTGKNLRIFENLKGTKKNSLSRNGKSGTYSQDETCLKVSQ
jgi:hypothetical protein